MDRFLTPSWLRIMSGLFTNLAAAWIVAMFATRDLLVLTGDIIFATVSLLLAVWTDKKLEKI